MKFEELYKTIITEDPDVPTVPEDHPAYGKHLAPSNPDATTFVLYNDFRLIDSTHRFKYKQRNYHGMLFTDLYYYMENPKRGLKDIIMKGNIPEQLKEKMPWDRDSMLSYFPELILGRIWRRSKFIAFWNTKQYVKKQFPNIINFIKYDMGANPTQFTFDIEDEPYSYEEAIKEMSPRARITSSNYSAINRGIHELSPEIKGQVMKELGVQPKVPVDIRDKYVRGGGD